MEGSENEMEFLDYEEEEEKEVEGDAVNDDILMAAGKREWLLKKNKTNSQT